MSAVSELMSEVISYGGLPLTRADAYRQCLADTGEARTADLFAFGPNCRRMDCRPISLAEYMAIVSANP